MPVGNCYFGTGIVDGIIYTIGGWIYNRHSRVFAYDPVTDEWSEKTAMPTARLGLGAGVVNKMIYAIGGAPHYTMSPLSIVEEYTPSGDTFPINTAENKAIKTPVSFVPHQNFPNPFNSETTIEYAVQQSSHVKLNIYNTLGQIVRTLVDEYETTGEYSVVWDGKDNSGNVVASGNYFYQIKTDGNALTKKMIFME